METYYQGLAKKNGWDSVIADEFKFTGGDMLKTDPVTGKQAYAEVVNRFSGLFTDMRVKEMIVDGDRAFVRANYDYTFPNGRRVSSDVAELWEAKNGKLEALTIFFDTLSFQQLAKA